MRGLIAFAIVAVASAGPALAENLPLPKNGVCPTGYRQSAQYCVPNANAKPAVQKQGPCPTGYRQSGNYCVKN